ncbi:MAG: GH3 auxin-responsive promoter family protein, partial [Bacteroidaceae bacterium]|nr:GH3 auxin-responsive promoter family protein [Bacteroidaceae bacterium]
MNETSLLKSIICRRADKISKYAGNTEAIQNKVLRSLIDSAKNTEWGREHKYDEIRRYSDFVTRVGVQDYETLKGYIERMRHGESDILWKGRCRWYAKSS